MSLSPPPFLFTYDVISGGKPGRLLLTNYLVALGYIEVELRSLRNHTFLVMQRTADQKFLH